MPGLDDLWFPHLAVFLSDDDKVVRRRSPGSLSPTNDDPSLTGDQGVPPEALLAGADWLEFPRAESDHGAGGSIETVAGTTETLHRPVYEESLGDGGHPGQTAGLAPVLTRGVRQAQHVQHGARPAPSDLVVRGVAQSPPLEKPAEPHCGLLPS